MSEPEDGRIPVALVIGAQIRTAAQQGVPIVIVRRGDAQSGAILLKINRLDGAAHVLMQARKNGALVWTPLGKKDPMPEPEADKLFAQQAAFDPDLWLIEIEDRAGRHWFPGDRVDAP
ncbi:MAG: DUF1491 family protein [Alphaproteobacteria bacterium]